MCLIYIGILVVINLLVVQPQQSYFTRSSEGGFEHFTVEVKARNNLFLVIFLGCGVECSKRDLKNSWIRPILIPYRCYNKKRVTKVFVYTRRRLSPKLKREVGIFQKGKIRQDFATREIQIKVHVTCVTSPPIHLLPSQNVL